MMLPYYCKIGGGDRFALEKGSYSWNAMLYIKTGTFRLFMNDVWQEMGPGSLVIFPEGVEFERYIIEHISYYLLRFKTDEELSGGLLPIGNHTRVINDLEYIRVLIKNGGESDEMLEHYLKDIFLTANEDVLLEKKITDMFILRVIEYFKKRLHEKILLCETAAAFNVSKTKLVNEFNKKAGMSPMQYVTKLRIDRAKRRLCNSDDPIATVAYDCGFENAYYFSNTFKKMTGVTPTAYRKENSV